MIKKAPCTLAARAETGDTRSKILLSALDEFAIRGIAGAKTREIAKNAGVNHACICYYFGGKEGMYHEIVRVTVADFQNQHGEFIARAEIFLKAPDKPKIEALALIKEFMISHFRLITGNPHSNKMFLVMRREEIYPTEAFDIFYAGILEPLYRIFGGLIDAAMGGGIGKGEIAVRSQMVLWLVTSFISRGECMRRLWGVDGFTESCLNNIEDIFAEYLEKMLK